MKSASLALFSLLLAGPLSCYAAEQLIPAGSLIGCTVSEPKLNSKTAAVGDPILCKVSYSEQYGRSLLPYDSYLEGRFEDFKDPGHLVGKGWMELKFDRMVIEPDTIVPIDAKVVGVPGYNVDKYGRILGKGHAVRDTVTWMIPILWPIDLLNLPRRGPRPTLKGETRLTLKIMDDLGIPETQPLPQEPSGLYRRPAPSEYNSPPPVPDQEPIAQAVPPPDEEQEQPSYTSAPQPVMMYAPPPVVTYAPPPLRYYVVAPPPPVYWYGPPRTVVLWRNGYMYRVAVY